MEEQQYDIAALREHPRQRHNFNDQTGEQYQLFLKDMKQNGQRQAVDITPDGTIVDGHHRVRAAKELGWTTIRVRIRSDLETDSEVELRAIEANQERRQLGGIAEIRLHLRKQELRQRRGLTECDLISLRDQIGEAIGKCGRQAQRLMDIARETPMEVQQAVDERRLTQDLARKVVRLDQRDKDEIAERIRAGECPRAVVREYAKSTKSNRSPTAELNTVGTALARLRRIPLGTFERLDRRTCTEIAAAIDLCGPHFDAISERVEAIAAEELEDEAVE